MTLGRLQFMRGSGTCTDSWHLLIIIGLIENPYLQPVEATPNHN